MKSQGLPLRSPASYLLRRESGEFYSPRPPASIREARFHEDLGRARGRITKLGIAITEEDEGTDRELGRIPDGPGHLRKEHGGELGILVTILRNLEGAEESQQQLVVEQLDIAAHDQVVADARLAARGVTGHGPGARETLLAGAELVDEAVDVLQVRVQPLGPREVEAGSQLEKRLRRNHGA